MGAEKRFKIGDEVWFTDPVLKIHGYGLVIDAEEFDKPDYYEGDDWYWCDVTPEAINRESPEYCYTSDGVPFITFMSSALQLKNI